MRAAWCLIPLAVLGCDDHLFPAIGESGNVAYTPDWSGTQAFLGDHCESCHPSLSPPAMPEGIADDIVNATGNYVVPGDPEASELWRVINGTSDQTALMPLGSAQPLPADVIAPLGEWITNGAPLN